MPNKCSIKLHGGAKVVPKRCVHIHLTTFPHALTLVHITETLFLLHHAVSDLVIACTFDE